MTRYAVVSLGLLLASCTTLEGEGRFYLGHNNQDDDVLTLFGNLAINPDELDAGQRTSYASLQGQISAAQSLLVERVSEERTATRNIEMFRRLAYTYSAAVGVFGWHANNASTALLMGGLSTDHEDIFHRGGETPWMVASVQLNCVRSNLGPLRDFDIHENDPPVAGQELPLEAYRTLAYAANDAVIGSVQTALESTRHSSVSADDIRARYTSTKTSTQTAEVQAEQNRNTATRALVDDLTPTELEALRGTITTDPDPNQVFSLVPDAMTDELLLGIDEADLVAALRVQLDNPAYDFDTLKIRMERSTRRISDCVTPPATPAATASQG